jgi:RNase P subunit RPR2
MFKDDEIKKFVTEKHFNNYNKKIDLSEEKQNLILSVDNKSNQFIGKISQTSIEDFKSLSKKHVLEVTNSINFLYYSKTKEIFCKNCNEEALFGKNCRNFIKCMNCLHTYCKYCGKNYSNGHFDFTGNNYCKIFYRRHCKYLPSIRNKCKEISVEFIIFLAGYFIFFIGSLNLIHVYLRKYTFEEKETSLAVAQHIIILILIYSVSIPILFLLLPFYPVLVAIFR